MAGSGDGDELGQGVDAQIKLAQFRHFFKQSPELETASSQNVDVADTIGMNLLRHDELPPRRYFSIVPCQKLFPLLAGHTLWIIVFGIWPGSPMVHVGVDVEKKPFLTSSTPKVAGKAKRGIGKKFKESMKRMPLLGTVMIIILPPAKIKRGMMQLR